MRPQDYGVWTMIERKGEILWFRGQTKNKQNYDTVTQYNYGVPAKSFMIYQPAVPINYVNVEFTINTEEK